MPKIHHRPILDRQVVFCVVAGRAVEILMRARYTMHPETGKRERHIHWDAYRKGKERIAHGTICGVARTPLGDVIDEIKEMVQWTIENG